jgi:UDP-N-acetyl-D-mannosaminuronate dehydrogenase
MASAWVRVVGVVGGGQMGSGIAQLAAAAQLDVILADVDQQALQRGMRNITSSLSKFVKKQALSQVRTRTRTRTKINSGFHQNSQFTKAHSKISKSCSNDFSVLFYAIRNPVCPSVSGFCGV